VEKKTKPISLPEGAAGLPDHYDGTDGNIQAAEDKKVDYFSQHRAGFPVD